MSDDEKTPETGTPATPPASVPTVLGEILGTVMGRVQDGLNQSDNPAGLQMVVSSLLERIGEAKKAQANRAAAEATSVPSIDGADDNVVSLDAARAAASAKPGLDMKKLFDETVARFVREQGEGGDEAEVTIDGAFVAAHGADLVRTVLGAVGQAWIGAIAGVDLTQGADDGAVSDPELADPEASPEDEAPAVKYDVLNILANLLKRAPAAAAVEGDGASPDAADGEATADDTGDDDAD